MKTLLFHSIEYILLSAALSLILIFPITSLLYKLKLVRNGEYDDSYKQIPTRRQKEGIPIMAGIIMVISIVSITLLFNYSRGYTLLPLFVFLLCAIIGGIDDIMNIFGRKRTVRPLRRTILLALKHVNIFKRIYFALLIPWSIYKSIFYSFSSRLGTGLHPHEKVLVQIIAGGIISYWLYFKVHWTLLWIPLFGYINIGFWLIPLTIFLVVLYANAVNITDGVDGLSAGLLLNSFSVFLALSIFYNYTQYSYFISTVIGTLLVYLYFNIKPARFEMGDIGSLSLGALLATISILMHREFLLFVTGLPYLVEVGSVIIQKLGKKLFNIQIFKIAPIHHHLEKIGWSEERIVMRFWVISFFLAIISIFIAFI